jgi:hypothetical protein
MPRIAKKQSLVAEANPTVEIGISPQVKEEAEAIIGEAQAQAQAQAASSSMKFADQVRSMIPEIERDRQEQFEVRRTQRREMFEKKKEQFRTKVNIFLEKITEEIDNAKKRLIDPSKPRMTTNIILPDKIDGVPLHIFLYGGYTGKPVKDVKRDFYERDRFFWKNNGIRIPPFQLKQIELFNQDGLFLLNVSDPSKGLQTRLILSAHTSPNEMKKTLWHNQNKLPDESVFKRYISVPRINSHNPEEESVNNDEESIKSSEENVEAEENDGEENNEEEKQ